MTKIEFDRRTFSGTQTSADPAAIWPDWKGENEHWLFVAPHDDDIVAGAGLTLISAIENQIPVSAAIVSNGRMGYCSLDQKYSIAEVRKKETQKSFEFLGVPKTRLYQFSYGDGSLAQDAGRRFAKSSDDPNAIEGGTGIQNSLTWVLRQVRPTRVFLPNRLDMHPDHQTTHHELLISIFHAHGGIWPELGPAIESIPALYEYATYCDFIAPPTMRIRLSDDLVEKRLAGLALYESQKQIELIVSQLRKSGGTEYLLEMAFDIIQPHKHDVIF
ncbi:MAG: PIG-L deacetylase family protein [Thermoguttaceae bacterium]